MANPSSRHGRSDILTGAQKAAILCMALGPAAAARIQQQLSSDESEAITVEIARMSNVDPSIAEMVLQEWLELLVAADSLAQGGLDFARDVLERAYGPQRAAAMLKRIQAQLADTAGLQRLRSADPTQLGSMLRNEHPQAIALILSHLQPVQTAAVLQELDPVLGAEVLYRMATMNKVAPEMLALIEKAMMSEDLTPQQGLTTAGGPHAVASILNVVPSTLEKALLDRVAERDPDLCEQVRNLMFVFEDISSLDQKSIQRLLRDVDQKELALALKGASHELQASVFGAMATRAQAALKEEIEMLGPQRKRDIETAQANIVAALRKLEDTGEIIIGGAAEDMVA